jgi:hypothetical protein
MATARSNRTRRRRNAWWADLDYEELLDVRLCDLDLHIEGTAIEQRVEALHDDFERAGLRFRPYVSTAYPELIQKILNLGLAHRPAWNTA